jgi:hypothetical protein
VLHKDSKRFDGDSGCGAFLVPIGSFEFMVIASDGEGWDHVSVSLKNRCPSWTEMCVIKKMFFKPQETVIQFHPAETQYVNFHPFCLHLWRNQKTPHELPPMGLV